jgi:hypothetical protein
LRKLFIIIAVIIGGVLGYGYWHSYTHASFHVSLDFKDAGSTKPVPLPNAEISFLDLKGRILASGTGDAQYNYVHLIHPVVGDCHATEKSASTSKEARKSWQECFAHLSTWIPDWAGKVRQISLKSPACQLENYPVAVSRYNSDWYLWWIPHPHIGGKPYTYYSLNLTIDEQDCIN